MSQARKNRKVLGISLLGITFMLGLVAASVPLYQLFCQVTGYGGTTQVADEAPGADTANKRVVVRFDASTARGMEWEFVPVQNQMEVALGEQSLAFYRVTNTSNESVTGTATFNVTPMKVGQYFNKIECFCFTEQVLAPGESADLPVSFFVDPALADDVYANEVTTLTLSYTFFPKRESRS